MSNRLISETSPYLLQHAQNPVDWYPWCDDAFEKAKKESKLVLVSIGYSACHWCHVMEHESFEDEETAKMMNEKYVCIKVDREERPDIDHYYMDAVQLISGRGGWPLNCFTLPNGKPIFGGTYFPKEQWMHLLQNLDNLYRNEPGKITEAAAEIEKGIVEISKLPGFNSQNNLLKVEWASIESIVSKMEKEFDIIQGGFNHAPKFPMPGIYEFLLYYAYRSNTTSISNHIYLTLDKMAMGGIYDHIGGGFSRYSTDRIWKAPHFEKMLYDNGQLMSLYAHGWQCKPEKLYKETVYGIHHFVSENLTSPEGGFYCALDADSEGREGEYYVWKREELQKLLGDDFSLFSEYFSLKNEDVWEEDKFILFRKMSDDLFCKMHNLSIRDFEEKKKNWIVLLQEYRQKRIAPALDDKMLASWNGLMLKGLADAYMAFGDLTFLDAAIKNADFISEKLMAKDGAIWRSYKNGKAAIPGFLDDYAFTADALFRLYQCTFDEKWLTLSSQLAGYAIKYFYDKDKNMFSYTSGKQKSFVAGKYEISDNVIPSSNSAMANLLFGLGRCIGNENYVNIAVSMAITMKDSVYAYPQGYYNWAILLLHLQSPFYEIAITGDNAGKFRDEINACYIPNKIISGARISSDLELLKEKFAENKTLVYVCENKTCFAPVHSPKEAIGKIMNCK